jgi:hypothetical protein
MYVITVSNKEDNLHNEICYDDCNEPFRSDSLKEAKKHLKYLKDNCTVGDSQYKLWYCVESKDTD